jgi:hypothetical protein
VSSDYRITIYSPEDGRQDVFVTSNPEAVSARLITSMEVGAWFKVERLTDTDSTPIATEPFTMDYKDVLFTDMTL